MPLVEIEIVGGAVPPALAQAVADEAGRIFGSEPGRTWARVRALAPDADAENDAVVPGGDRPVFVTVLKRSPPTGADLAQEVAALTHAIARLVGRPHQHVHVVYEPAGAGRVAFGGELV